MVGEGICRRAYWQAHVQCSDARDLSAPLTWQRGDHSATQAQSLEASPFLCHVVESSHPSALGGVLAYGDRVGLFANAEERPHDEKCPYKIIFGDDDSGQCYTSLDKCSARVVGKPAEKVCCFAERIIEPTLDMCDPNNTHSVYQCPNSKYNSTFFENMGYRGQSCEDERMLWEFIDQPFTEGWMGVC